MRWFLPFLLIGAACAQSLTWDQPTPTGDQIAPEGWQLFANGAQVWQGVQQVVEVDALALPPGDHDLAVRAYSGDVVSGFSNTIALLIENVSGAPAGVAPDIYFRGGSRQSAGATYGG